MEKVENNIEQITGVARYNEDCFPQLKITCSLVQSLKILQYRNQQ